MRPTEIDLMVARAERERIEKLLRHYGSVVDLEK